MLNKTLPENLSINPQPDDAAFPKWEEIFVHAIEGKFCANDEKQAIRSVAAIEYIDNTHILESNDIFLVAVPSDKSWQGSLWKAHYSLPAAQATGNQYDRAAAIAVPLAESKPEYTFVVMFYDEETPATLYAKLREKGAEFSTLSLIDGKIKNPATSMSVKDGKEIFPDISEHMSHFKNSYAYPAVENKKSVGAALYDTDVTVVDLVSENWNARGDRYLSAEGYLGFEVPDGLKAFTQLHIDRERAREAAGQEERNKPAEPRPAF